MGASVDAIRQLVEPALVSAGLELWDVEMSGDVLRVLVDRPGGVDLDALSAAAGQIVSPILDEHPDLAPTGSYQLEVSSPGLERTLRTVEQYRRYVGHEVSVKTSVPVEGARRHQGRLTEIGVGTISVEADGRVVDIPHERIDRARTVLEWGPQPKKGAVKRSAAPGRSQAAKPVASNEKDTPR